ncbi:MAG: HD domain-containing protein [Chloroflexi bacterium]|jgi:poly(A) polymerase/tRNA nucleotidyltransferase (CCA-adding enzyme)|nr:HD domain-containing protein [Chloroflexota bacterium]
MTTLWAAGHAAYLVGGCVRDLLAGRVPADWDVGTDARPDRLQALFPAARYENRFGTVGVEAEGSIHEVTTFRADGVYRDHRRPDAVSFADGLEEDLGRRDFTINAMALGRDPRTEGPAAMELVDPFGGRSDLAGRVLRAVGDPETRFSEDALRLLRAARFAAQLGFTVEPATLAAMTACAPLAGHLSGERVHAELGRLLAAPRPSVGLRLLEVTGVLAVVAPELALQRGVPQAKIPGDDLWDHTCRTVDAVPADRILVRWAALLHDVGKPATFADGHFVGHESAGATLAAAWLEGLRAPRAEIDLVVHLVAQHMFAYEPAWTDAAVRRFIRRVGPASLDDLLALRAADNVGSGQPAGNDGLDELSRRCGQQLAARVALRRAELAVDGDDLAGIGIPPGPLMGRLLSELLDRVLADPMLNDRGRLLELAREIAEDVAPDGAVTAR